MAKISSRDLPRKFNQPSFAIGEVAPELYGRVDLEMYYSGLRKAQNFIIRQYGGAANRPGGTFVAEAYDQSQRGRLIPFSFNEEQTYVLNFNGRTMRVIADGGEVIETAQAITNVTNGSPATITCAAHGYSNGDDVYISGITGMNEINGRTVRIKNATANTFEITDLYGNNVDTTMYKAYSSGGTVAKIYTVTSASIPWVETDLRRMNYAQSNDTMTIVHPDYYPRDITRTANDSWTVSLFNRSEGPFKDVNGTSTSVYVDAVTGTVTIIASDDLFTDDMVGDLFYIEQSPDDETARWDVQMGVRNSEIRRAGANYYQAPTAAATTKTITGISAANPAVVTATSHGFSNDDVVYISGVVGMTEINDKFYKVVVKTANTFALKRLDDVDVSSSGYTAYSSAGTAELAQATGTVLPDHVEGTAKDGDPGVTWTYLHSGFGIVQIASFVSATEVTATVIKRLPDNVVGSGNTTTNWAFSAWSETEGYPAACAYHKQRMVFGGSRNLPSTLWASGTGLRTFFGRSNPILDDESITATLDTTTVNAIRHFVSLKQLVALTSSSEHVITGVDGRWLASQPLNVDVEGNNGSDYPPPLVIGSTALFVQDLGTIVRSLQYSLEVDAFTGVDLTDRSPHLFRDKSIVEWAYQKHPLSIVWSVMDDGTMNALTFMEQQKVYAWAPQDTDGEYESICTIREGREIAVYLYVKRTINGQTRRYVERMATRYPATYRDAIFMDSAITYDGRNTGTGTVTITGGTDWEADEFVTVTFDTPVIRTDDVGNQVVFRDGDNVYRITITAYSTSTVATGRLVNDLPAGYRSTARTDWEFARSVIEYVGHLEGKDVAVLSDGVVIDDMTVEDGRITLPSPGAVVHVGLPYVSDLETLDFAQPAGQSKDAHMTVAAVSLTVQESSKVKVGINGFTSLKESRIRTPDMNTDNPPALTTGVVEVITNSSYSKLGRICVRQDAPLPITINCITPEIEYGA